MATAGADEPSREVADRQPASCDIRAARTFEQRVDRRPDIRADHQSDRGVQRQDSLAGQRHDEQCDSYARMRGPGHRRSEQRRDHGIGRDPAHEDSKARNILVMRHDLE